MSKFPTLRQRVSQISTGAFLLASAVMLAGFFVYSITKRNIAQKEIVKDLTKSSAQQIEQLIPSFLLPEQSAGVDLLLEKFKRDEGLTRIQLVSSLKQLPADFSECSLKTESAAVCQSENGRETAVVAPIFEGSRNFGWIFKSKLNSSSMPTGDILQLIGIFAVMLGLTFTTIYVLIARLLSRTMPKALDDLVAWIEADLSDKTHSIPTPPFKELIELKGKISEVMDRHNKDRDQAVIGQLTSGIMHDIRTPLHSVLSALFIVEKYEPGSPKRARALEELAMACKDHIPLIGKIIETTLDGGRNIQIKPQSCDLVETVRDGLTQTDNIRSLRRVCIEMRVPEHLRAFHDPVQVVRVVQNLVKNAIEASSESSSQPVVAIEISETSDGSAQITVEDNGSGLPCAPEKIFRAFRSSKVHGTGLGLLVSRRIIEAHRGIIRAQNNSSLGGARFEVVLPRNEQDNQGGIA